MPEVVVQSQELIGAIRCVRYGNVTAVKKDTIKTEPAKESISTKEIIADEKSNLVVFPNPVLSGTSVNLSFTKLEDGYYSYQLLNQGGQVVQQKEIWIDQEAGILNVEVPSLAAGGYLILLRNTKTGKKLTAKVIIQ